LPSRGKEVMSAELIDTDEIAPNAPAQPMTTCATNCWSAPPHPLALLRARRERPRCRRTADKRYEIAPLHC